MQNINLIYFKREDIKEVLLFFLIFPLFIKQDEKIKSSEEDQRFDIIYIGGQRREEVQFQEGRGE